MFECGHAAGSRSQWRHWGKFIHPGRIVTAAEVAAGVGRIDPVESGAPPPVLLVAEGVLAPHHRLDAPEIGLGQIQARGIEAAEIAAPPALH
jgi:hypothetical protein